MAKVYFVTGKGGTGKSSFSRTLAANIAGEDKRVLLLKINSFALSHEGDIGPRQVNKNFWEQKVHQRRAVEEYFTTTLSKLPIPGAFQKFAQRVQEGISSKLLGNKFVMKFIDACPGLTPTIFLGKICWEAKSGGPSSGQNWDVVVVDAPSTGQALQIFESSKILSRILSQGLIAKHIHETLLFSSNDNFEIHIVTLPEEGPLQECVEMLESFTKLELKVAKIWINKVASETELSKLEGFKSEKRDVMDLVQVELDRIADQKRSLTEFKKRVGTIEVSEICEHLLGEPLDLEAVQT
jgi:anion-transporting  ArsA/GET3 family ATPase